MDELSFPYSILSTKFYRYLYFYEILLFYYEKHMLDFN